MEKITICPEAFHYFTGVGKAPAQALQGAIDCLIGISNPKALCMKYNADTCSWEVRQSSGQDAVDGFCWLDLRYDNDHRLHVPLKALVFDSRELFKKHVIYEHVVAADWSDPTGIPKMSRFRYIGQTKRGWHHRLIQHKTAAKSGSNTLFHRCLREHNGRIEITRILGAGLSAAAADTAEEDYVYNSLFPLGLNMIPGGKAGIRFLFKHAGPRAAVDADHREETLSEIIRVSRHAGSNAALSARWSDDAFAIRMICGPEGRLKPDQIATGRLLKAAGHDIAAVTGMIGAKNPQQTQRMLNGQTYSRVA